MPKTYEIYWTGLASKSTLTTISPPRWWTEPRGKAVNPKKMLTEVLENTPHFFVFILTTEQWSGFDTSFTLHKWDRFLFHRSKNKLWNPNYTKDGGYKPRLTVVVLKGTGTDES